MTAIETLTEMMAGLAHLIVTLILSIGVGAVVVLIIRKLFLIDYLRKLDKKQLAYGHEKIILQVVEWGVMALSFTYFADAWWGVGVAICGVSYMTLQRAVFPWIGQAIPDPEKSFWVNAFITASTIFLIADAWNGSFLGLISFILLMCAAYAAVPENKGGP